MTRRLHDGLNSEIERGNVPGISIVRPVEANMLFIRMPDEVAQKASETAAFNPWPFGKNEWRLVCSFDTSAEDVDALVKLFAQIADADSSHSG